MVCIILLEHSVLVLGWVFFIPLAWQLSTLVFTKIQIKLGSVWLLSCSPSTSSGLFFQDFWTWGSIVKATSPAWHRSQANGPRSCTVTDNAQGLKVKELADAGRFLLCQLQALTRLSGTSHPFSLHCQATHSCMHNHAMLSLISDSTNPKWFIILLADTKNQFSKSLG